MKRLSGVLIPLLLTVGACGGAPDSDTETTSPSEPGPTSATENTVADTATDETTADDGAATGSSLATVTLNGNTYRFGESDFIGQRCNPDLFGVFAVQLEMVDEAGVADPAGSEIFLTLLSEDADPDFVAGSVDAKNRVEITFRDSDVGEAREHWIADEEEFERRDLDPGTSQVDEYSIDGNTATGSATFYEAFSEGEYFAGNADSYLVATGEFEVTCAG